MEHFEYLEEETCNEDLKCSICLEPLQGPVTHQACAHMFCAACLRPLTSCPLCRETLLNQVSAVIPRAVLNQLDALKVKCGHCAAEMPRSALAAHKIKCPPGSFFFFILIILY